MSNLRIKLMLRIFIFFCITITVLLFSSCSNLLEVKDWRLLEPETDMLNSPASIYEKARLNLNPVNKYFDSGNKQEILKNEKVSVNSDVGSDSKLQNMKLELFVNYPVFVEKNVGFQTIFTQQPASDTFNSISPLSITLELLLDFYQKLISPHLNTSCPFCTSCSRYARKAVREFGPILGSIMAIDRLFRCNRTAGDKYFIGFRKDSQGNLIYPLSRCFLDEPSTNNIFK